LGSLDVSVPVLHAFDLPHNGLVVKIRNPAEADVEATLYLELVESCIKCLFLDDEHFVNFEN
jgi:hypothetical protein